MGVKRKDTVEKYYNKLKVLLKAVDSTTFSAGQFLTLHGLNKKFMHACEEIGYIKQTGKVGLRITYKANFTSDQVKPETGEIIRKSIIELTRRQRVRSALAKHKKELNTTSTQTIPVNKDLEELTLREKVRDFIEQKFAEVGYVKEPVKEMKLSEIRSEDLIGELQKREYEGTLSQLVVLEGVRVLKTIEINIKNKDN